MNTRLMSIVAAGAVVAAAVFTLQTNQNTAGTSVDYNAIMPAAGNYATDNDTTAASDVEISTDTAEAEAISKEIAGMFDDEEDMGGNMDENMADAINDSIEPAAGHEDMAEHAEDHMDAAAEAVEEHAEDHMDAAAEAVEEHTEDHMDAAAEAVEEHVEDAAHAVEDAVEATEEEVKDHVEEEAHDAVEDMMKH